MVSKSHLKTSEDTFGDIHIRSLARAESNQHHPTHRNIQSTQFVVYNFLLKTKRCYQIGNFPTKNYMWLGFCNPSLTCILYTYRCSEEVKEIIPRYRPNINWAIQLVNNFRHFGQISITAPERALKVNKFDIHRSLAVAVIPGEKFNWAVLFPLSSLSMYV